MAPSAIVKHRFQNSLDMIAARSLRTTDRSLQSGTGNAWCIMDSPTLGKMPTGPGRADASLRLEESTMATGSRLTSQAVSVAPLNVRRNVKKIRRRGLVSGVHLDLPPSPMPTPSPPQTSITFTAEWDWNEKSFIFTSFDSSCPLAPTTTHFTRDMASIPVNVDDDYFSHSPALSTPSVYSVSISSPHHPSLSAIETEWDDRSVTSSIASRPMPSPDSASSSPCTPVSEIFDDESFYTHGRKLSQSTVASSVDDLSEDISETQSKAQDALDEFIEELNGSAVPNVIDDRTVDSVRSIKPRNLLLPPLSAYEQLLNRSTELEIKPLSIRRPASASPISRPSRASRPLPDVPSSANSTLSIYSPDSRSRFSPVSPLDSAWPSRSNSLRQQLQLQLRRTLFNVRPQSKR